MVEVRYSVVIPVYNNQDSIRRLVCVLGELFSRLRDHAEAIFVIDGSPDRSLAVLELELSRAPFPAQIIEHSRNFGSFTAIRTGIAAARGAYIGVIAADLQEPPELVERFFEILGSDKADIVVGRRSSRDDGTGAALSNIYWAIYRRYVVPDIPPGGVDVFGINRQAAVELLRLGESHTSLVAQLFWLGMRRSEVDYQRTARQEGSSGWTMAKKLRYLGDSIFAFTDLPIRFLTVLGGVGIAATVLVSGIVLLSWLFGAISAPGYTPIMLVVLGCTFMMILSLGIVGSYVWRAYENGKSRPLAVVQRSRIFL